MRPRPRAGAAAPRLGGALVEQPPAAQASAAPGGGLSLARLLVALLALAVAGGLAAQASFFGLRAAADLRAPVRPVPLRTFVLRVRRELAPGRGYGLVMTRRPPGAVERVPRTLRYLLYPRAGVHVYVPLEWVVRERLRGHGAGYLFLVGPPPRWLRGRRGGWWRLLAAGPEGNGLRVRLYAVAP